MNANVPAIENGEDWRTALVSAARSAGERVTARERAKNPAIPNNFLDVSDAGFPADIIVKGVQMPATGVPAEMAQYRGMIESQWLHVPWSAISSNGGLDGKAFVPGATKHDLGGGHFVAALSGYYLMYADREQYEKRRALNSERANASRAYKLQIEEEADIGVRKSHRDGGESMSLEELLDFEKRIGEEAPRKGEHIGS